MFKDRNYYKVVKTYRGMGLDKDCLGNLERVLRRKRLFMLDTCVLLGGESKNHEQGSDLEYLAYKLKNKIHKKHFLKSIANTISKHKNIRLTYEVYDETFSQLGKIIKKGNKEEKRIVENIEGYLMNNKRYFLNGDFEKKGWKRGKFLDSGVILSKKFSEQYPKLKPLAKADVGVLLAGLEMVLKEEKDYEKMDLITGDYGIVKGAELMFQNLNKLNLDGIENISQKAVRRARHRCMKVILKKEHQDYDCFFDSYEFCRNLENSN